MRDIHYPVAHRSQEEIDQFKTRYEDFDENIIPSIVKDVIGERLKKVERSTSWGSGHVIYFLKFAKPHRDLVFRANVNMSEPERIMYVEKLITDLVSQHDIPTNRIIYVDVTRKKYDFDFTIQERLGGIDPEDEFAGTEEEYDQFNFETGQAIAKLGDIKLDGFGRFDETIAVAEDRLEGNKTQLSEYINVCCDEDLDSLEELSIITSRQAQRIKDFFQQRKDIIDIKQGSLVHYDLADHNLRYKGGQLEAIFDWETAVVASPVLDLASCPTWRSHYPKREKLLEGYQSIKALPDNFEELEKVFFLRTMVWKMRFAIRAGILNETRKARFDEALLTAGIK